MEDKRDVRIASQASVMKELGSIESLGAKIIIASEEIYPKLLRTLPDAPPVLTVKGNMELLMKPKTIAIVGARNASTNGCSIASGLAQELGKNDYIIVSGLAKGIDTAAHTGALDTGSIAVIASGIDGMYPEENRQLYHALYEKGLVVSEFPFGTPPKATHFSHRNRIISGLSMGVIIAEAAMKSGTLITARFALEQNREIFAIPGSPLDPRSQGTNRLIKDGACLLESADDVLSVFSRTCAAPDLFEKNEQDFSSPVSTPIVFDEKELEKWRAAIIAKLSYTPTSLDELMKHTGVPVEMLSRIIVELELAGRIERVYGNKAVLLQSGV